MHHRRAKLYLVTALILLTAAASAGISIYMAGQALQPPAAQEAQDAGGGDY